MNKIAIREHIALKQKEKRTHRLVLRYLEKLDAEPPFTESTRKELTARLSSKVAACDRSIDDHTKLLK